MKQFEVKIKQLNEQKDQLEVNIISMKEKFDIERTELCKLPSLDTIFLFIQFLETQLILYIIVTAVKDLKTRNNHLLENIKLQTKTTNKIDRAREKQNEK